MKDRRGRELSKEKIEHYINIQRGAHELKGRIQMYHCGNDLSQIL